jgi:hypothetical protein
MKKLIVLSVALLLTSCATVFNGPVTEYQRTKPLPGEPARKVKVVPLVANLVFFWPGTIVDFATGAIYKNEPQNKEINK